VATVGDVREHPKVADGASELLQDVFGRDKNPSRLVYGVASLPLGTPVELEIDLRGVGLMFPCMGKIIIEQSEQDRNIAALRNDALTRL
jgi:hypothetical protein